MKLAHRLRPFLAALLLAAPFAARAQDANFQRGCELFQKEDFAAAAAAFEKCAAASPANSKYQQWLGRALGLQAQRAGVMSSIGLVGKVRAAFEKAVELDPNNLSAREDLATMYRLLPGMLGGSTAKANEQIQKIRERDPAYAAQIEGNALAGEKKFDAAAAAYAKSIQLNGSRPAPYLALVLLAQQAKDWNKAWSMLERALAIDPKFTPAIYQVGRTSALSGQQLERGEAALRSYLKMPIRFDLQPPSYSGAHFRLGNILEKKGDNAGAAAAYDQALRLDPANKDAKAAREKLKL